MKEKNVLVIWECLWP